MEKHITCTNCKKEVLPLPFCPHCGAFLKFRKEKDLASIGPYEIIKSIGRGGMGEVFLAYDTICGRKIALKKVRDDLKEYRQVYNRFLREARITSSLTHPAIIPIYTIHHDDNHTYYTMPFVEGSTLKAVLLDMREKDNSDGAIPYLIRIFLAICQAIAYAHSKSILHRDLKPENIIIGTYGEVLILDWGLAKLSGEQDLEEEVKIKTSSHSTLIGKVVGTIGYMAPERALGQPTTVSTDIYSLGVILYQILTLKLPFRRKNLEWFRENMKNEVLYDPIEVAPYRDIPKELSEIVLKCLAVSPEGRYQAVDELIKGIENYIEGKAEWFQVKELSIKTKGDWEFQEHILIAEHTAITRTAEISEWVKLMISKEPFADNIKIETEITPNMGCQGIGILFNIPEAHDREQLNDGYCLWISTDKSRAATLLRNSVEVLYAPDSFLEEGKKHLLTIEKIDNSIRFFINGVEQFNYIGRLPLIGTHVGVLARDTDFSLAALKVWVGSQNIMVNCLAVPDTFLAHKDYQKALSEYRRISYAFAGRAEGREAILRAGITLLEEGKAFNNSGNYELSLLEFERLKGTPGAPLEYLGKALVYEALQDVDEEVKCFELAYRRYPKHPLLHTLQDQILFRIVETSRSDRKAVYQFLLLALRYFPNPLEMPALNNIINYLKLHWEPIEFLPDDLKMVFSLSFWSHKNYILQEEAIKNPIASIVLLYALNEITLMHEVLNAFPLSSFLEERKFLAPFFADTFDKAAALIPDGINENFNYYIPLLDRALEEQKPGFVHKMLHNRPLTDALVGRKLWALLLEDNLKQAGELIHSIPQCKFFEDSSILYFLYGCWLLATEGQEIAMIHFNAVLEEPFPRSSTLAAHYLTGKLDASWYKKAFDFERWQLQRQLALVEMILKRAIK